MSEHKRERLTRMKRRLAGVGACAACIAIASAASGCMSRRVSVTSEPSGATVTVNDVEIGRTPVEADFTFYGVYDVLVTKEGFEPLRNKARAKAPLYEFPPVDLAASATGAEKVVRWHFTLEPALERRQIAEEFERGLIERAKSLREGKIDAGK
jgi:PEGA domain